MWIWVANKFEKFDAKRLNWCENIPKSFGGYLFSERGLVVNKNIVMCTALELCDFRTPFVVASAFCCPWDIKCLVSFRSEWWWQWWVQMIAVVAYRWIHGPSRLSCSEGWQLLGTVLGNSQNGLGRQHRIVHSIVIGIWTHHTHPMLSPAFSVDLRWPIPVHFAAFSLQNMTGFSNMRWGWIEMGTIQISVPVKILRPEWRSR